MPIINQTLWDNFVKVNSDDGYSKAVVTVARGVMEILDTDPTPLEEGYYPTPHAAHTLICAVDDYLKVGGITGFQASGVAYIIRECHSRGAEFNTSYENKKLIEEMRKTWENESAPAEQATDLPTQTEPSK